MKQLHPFVRRSTKALMTTMCMFVFTVSVASADVTTAPNSGTPYNYTNPDSTAPSYNDVGLPVNEEANSLSINNQLLGLSGPVQISGTYSSNYGSGVQAEFSHMLGFNDAIGLLGAYASEENRIDITWAHAWTENQRTKLSAERLEAKMDFDYDSGSATAWVPQYAYGAAYQYLFNKSWLKNVELSGYYANAQSQDLSTVRFTDGSNGYVYDNYRHIAGATSKGSEATLNVSPWVTGLVGLGLNYDNVQYNTKYDDTDAENSSGLGFTLSLEQILSKHVKLNLEGSQREIYDNYAAGVSFLTPSNLEIGLNGERTIGENGSASDSQFNLSLAYFFDDKNRYKNGYSLAGVNGIDLAQWASKSVAYMDEVLAAADQKTVLVSTPSVGDEEEQEALLTAPDETPVLNLMVGEINRISIADYIEKLNLTDAQKQSTPVIKGGPTGVEFLYDTQTESLVTKTEVPESAVTMEGKPLVIAFPQVQETSGLDRSSLTKKSLTDALSELTFRVTVGGSVAPTLNPAFNSTPVPQPVVGHAAKWVLYYENTAPGQANGPADENTMFLNPNTAIPYLTMSSGYPTKTGDTNNCYTLSYDNSQAGQTFTITAKASDVCPGNATISVRTQTQSYASPIQTITLKAASASSPFVGNGPITSPVMISGQTYAHTFTSNEVSPGVTGTNSETFDTDSTYTKVFDTGTTGLTCTDVTSSSGLALGFSNDKTVAILESKSTIPASLQGHKLKIYVRAKNTASSVVADNGTTSNCAGQPFTVTPEGTPTIPNNINMGTATVDQSPQYSYNFMTQGGVTTGSSNLNTSTSTVTFQVNGTTVTDTNLVPAISGTSISVSGNVNPKYAGQTIQTILNLTNTQGLTANNTAAPATLNVVANSLESPSVGGDSTLTSANQVENYPGYTFTNISPGTSRSYAGLNTASNTGTYVKVADASGNDVTSLMNVTLSANGSALTLQSNGSPVSDTLAGQYNVYVHVINDANQVASNCSDENCESLTAGKPYILTVNDPTTINPDINMGQTSSSSVFAYDFVQQGTVVVGNSGLNGSTSTLTMKLSDGTVVTPSQIGLTPIITANDVALGNGTEVVNAGYAGQTIYVYLNLVDNAGFAVNNNSAPAFFTIDVNNADQPQQNDVGHNLTATVEDSAYNYAYPSSPMLPGPSNSTQTFNTTKTVATVIDTGNANTDVSGGFSLTFSPDKKAITNLVASSSTVANLVGPLQVSYTAVNEDNQSLTSTAFDTIGTDSIDFDTVPMTPATVSQDYNYSFKDSANLKVGSTGLTGSVVFSDPNAGLSASFVDTNADGQNDDVVISGTPLPGHTGTINITLNLQTPDGLLTKTNNTSLSISTNNVNAPVVVGGAIDNGTQFKTYQYPFPTTGTGVVVYAGDNGESFDSEKTTFTVKDANDQVQTGLFTLEYGTDASNNNVPQITLSSGVNTLPSQGPWTVDLTIVNADGQTTSGSFTFNADANNSYDPTVGTTGVQLVNAVVDGANSQTYNYGYTNPPMIAGQPGAQFDTTQTKALVYTDAAKTNQVNGFSLVYNAENTAITGITAPSTVIQSLPANTILYVYYQAVNTTNPNDVVTSTTADTIKTAEFVIPTTALPGATVGTSYGTYDFASQNNLLLGSAGIDTAGSSYSMTLTRTGSAPVVVSSSDVGLTPAITSSDLTVSGTPNVSYAGTLTISWSLSTPADSNGNVFTKTIATTIQIGASNPVVISGKMPSVSLGKTYTYTFANTGAGGDSGPVVSPGVNEYFDETNTTVSVKDSSGNDLSNLFELVYGSSDVLGQAYGSTTGNNIVTLQSKGTLDVAGDLTVSFHVENLDSTETKAASGNAGTVTVGSVPGYLYCPSSATVQSRPMTSISTALYPSPGKTGTPLTYVNFNYVTADNKTDPIQLSKAQLINGNLVCSYQPQGSNGTAYSYSTYVPVPSDAKGYGSGWNGSTCSPTTYITADQADSSCQVTYSFTG